MFSVVTLSLKSAIVSPSSGRIPHFIAASGMMSALSSDGSRVADDESSNASSAHAPTSLSCSEFTSGFSAMMNWCRSQIYTTVIRLDGFFYGRLTQFNVNST